jgi:hypothetical protein
MTRRPRRDLRPAERAAQLARVIGADPRRRSMWSSRTSTRPVKFGRGGVKKPLVRRRIDELRPDQLERATGGGDLQINDSADELDAIVENIANLDKQLVGFKYDVR